jgi:hypothetical protein
LANVRQLIFIVSWPCCIAIIKIFARRDSAHNLIRISWINFSHKIISTLLGSARRKEVTD